MASMQNHSGGRYAFLRALDVEQLEKLLKTDYSDSLSEEASEEFIDAIIEVMIEKENETPSGRFPDVDKAWTDFQTYYNVPERDGQLLYPGPAPSIPAPSQTPKAHHGKHILRRVALAACFCIVMALAMAQACGVNLIAQFLEWREETFVLHTSSSGGQMTLEHTPKGEYASMTEALAHYGVTDTIVPTWIPDGFSIQYVRAKEAPHSVNLTASYTAGKREIGLKVYFDPDDSGADVHAEHSDPASEQYTANGITFLLSSNNEQYQASWVIGRYACNMNGDLTESEIKQMLNSISTEG